MDALSVVLNGIAVLVALAWIVGRVEANARDGAWQRIADARRILKEQERRPPCDAADRCPGCPWSRS